MTIETFSLPSHGTIAWMNKFDWGTGRLKSVATQNAFPVVDSMEWLKPTDFIDNVEVSSFTVSVTDSSSAFRYVHQELIQSSEQIRWEHLEAAAHDGNEAEFIAMAKTIDWEKCNAEGYIKAVKLALSATAYLKARLLATDGAKRYNEDPELQKYALVLAPPKVLPNHTPADPNIRKNRDWLMEHGDEYPGQWVALQGGEFLGAAPTLKELIQKIGDPRGKNILVTQV
jgi:hypothetical protein